MGQESGVLIRLSNNWMTKYFNTQNYSVAIKEGKKDGFTVWDEHGNIIEQITYKKIRVEMP